MYFDIYKVIVKFEDSFGYSEVIENAMLTFSVWDKDGKRHLVF